MSETIGDWFDRIGAEIIHKARLELKGFDESFQLQLENLGLQLRAAAYQIKRKEKL